MNKVFLTVALAVCAGLCLCAGSCSQSLPQIQGPYGSSFTSGTLVLPPVINLDALPPAKSYNGQLEK